MTSPDPKPKRQLSYARLVFFSMGGAALVLVATSLAIGLAEPGPILGLVIAIAGVVAAVGVLGFVATRMTNNAFADPAGKGTPPEQ